MAARRVGQWTRQSLRPSLGGRHGALSRAHVRHRVNPLSSARVGGSCFRPRTPRRFMSLKGYGWTKERNFAEHVQTLIEAGLITQPPWYDAIRRMPPIVKPVYPKPPRIEFPEDKLLQEILKQVPILKMEVLFWNPGEMTIAQRMALRQLELMEIGQAEDLAFLNMHEEFQADIEAFEKRMKPKSEEERWTDDDFYEALSWRLQEQFEQRRMRDRPLDFKDSVQAPGSTITALDVLQAKMELASQAVVENRRWDTHVPDWLAYQMDETMKVLNEVPTSREVNELLFLRDQLKNINKRLFEAAGPEYEAKVKELVQDAKMLRQQEVLKRLSQKAVDEADQGRGNLTGDESVSERFDVDVEEPVEAGSSSLAAAPLEAKQEAVESIREQLGIHSAKGAQAQFAMVLKAAVETARVKYGVRITPEDISGAGFGENLTQEDFDSIKEILGEETVEELTGPGFVEQLAKAYHTESSEGELSAVDSEEEKQLDPTKRLQRELAELADKIATDDLHNVPAAVLEDERLEMAADLLQERLQSERKGEFDEAVQQWRTERRQWHDTAQSLLLGKPTPQVPQNIIGMTDKGAPVYVGDRGGTETPLRSDDVRAEMQRKEDAANQKLHPRYPARYAVHHELMEYEAAVMVRRLRMRDRRLKAGLTVSPPKREELDPKFFSR